MEAQKRNKIVVIIGAVVAIIILLLSLLSCGGTKKSNDTPDTKYQIDLDGQEKIYDTMDEAKTDLEALYIVDGVDAVAPAPTTDLWDQVGNKVNHDDGTWSKKWNGGDYTGYNPYPRDLYLVDWEDATQFKEGELLYNNKSTVVPLYGLWYYSENEVTNGDGTFPAGFYRTTDEVTPIFSNDATEYLDYQVEIIDNTSYFLLHLFEGKYFTGNLIGSNGPEAFWASQTYYGGTADGWNGVDDSGWRVDITGTIYDDVANPGEYTDSILLGGGTAGTWGVEHPRDGIIDGAPTEFNFRSEAVAWITANGVDEDLIIEV